MYYGSELQQQSESKHKRAVRRDFYRICKKTNVIEFAKVPGWNGCLPFLPLCQVFGLTAEQFGENTLKGYMVHEPSDPDEDPETLAINFICTEFPNVDLVLKGNDK